jgi:hypothetical protein
MYGIILYDPEGYMASKLARIREIIEEAGLYRLTLAEEYLDKAER